MSAFPERRWTHPVQERLRREPYVAPPGPWWDESDKVQWVDAATGLDCLIVRGPMGSWCGYVGLPPGHPWRDSGDWDGEVDVHGGVTYGPAPCMEDAPEGHGVCHVPYPGRPADVAWVGFDCGHAFDLQPVMLALEAELFPARAGSELDPRWRDVYRDESYVRGEVAQLAAQAGTAAGQRRPRTGCT
jgi:hypothetical protein